MQNSTVPPSPPTSTQRNRPRRLWGWAVLVLLCGVLLYFPLRIGYTGFQVYGSAQRLIRSLQALDRSQDFGLVQARMATLSGDLAQLQAAVHPLAPVLRRMGFVPRYGPLLASADGAVDAAVQAAALVDETLTLAVDAEIDLHTDGDWVRLGLALAPLAEEFNALEAQLAALPLSDETVAGRRLMQLHAAVELGATAVAIGEAWPDLLGTTRPATYLLLIQNNHELRATGGFISAVAPATWRNGTLQPVEFVDSYAIYAEEFAYPPAPPPMQSYMEIELLTLRDGNWSPDLPTSARLIRTLYQQHTGLTVDGVITVDLDAVAQLLPAFGQLNVAGVDTAVTATNVERVLVELWNDPVASSSSAATPYEGDWWAQRKDFVGQLAGAIFARLRSRHVDPAALAGGIVNALDRRSLQVVLFDSAVQPVLAARGWDGALQPQPDADYLAVVDTNMGYNKVDAVLGRGLDYRVVWPNGPAQQAEATLTITYTHPITGNDPVCKPESYYGARYEDMMARCYFAYSRVYVPPGSELIDVQGWLDGTVTSRPGEAGTQQFAGYFMLNPGTQHQVTLRYRLPSTIQRDDYQLILQRQAGTDPLPLTVQVGGVQTTEMVVDGTLIWDVDQAPPTP